MRKIETAMNRAIIDRQDWRQDNTRVEYEQGNEISRVYLHGNLISEIGEGFIKLYSCGYRTNTTKSRLSSILKEHGNGDKIFQKDFQWFVKTNGEIVPFSEGMILR